MTTPFDYRTTPFDYGQQLHAFLQAWRQLLESLAALTPQMPFPGPPMAMPATQPSAPATPPAPADYTQQLFGYLQAWRQYLEQSAGASGAARPASSSRPFESASAGPPPTGAASAAGAYADTSEQSGPPTSPGSSQTVAGADRDNSGENWPPKKLTVTPLTQDGTQWPTDVDYPADPMRLPISPGNQDLSIQVPPKQIAQAGPMARGEQLVRPPDREFAARSRPSLAARQTIDAARARPSAPSSPADATSAVRGARTSQFRGLADRAGLTRDVG